jgi:hypothetical protein
VPVLCEAGHKLSNNAAKARDCIRAFYLNGIVSQPYTIEQLIGKCALQLL